MNRIFARALCATTLAAFSASASAVPIHFDFTGTVYQADGTYAQSGLEGMAVSGGYVFETENLTRMESPDLGMVQYFDLNVLGSYAFLNVGSRSITFPFYPQGNTTDIVFHDSVCPDTVFHCSASDFEYFDLYARSLDADFDTVSAPGFVGTHRNAFMDVSATNWSVGDYIDWTTARPEDIASLPYASISGAFSEATYICPAETFCTASDYGVFAFTIDSVTRSIGPVSVPEPGPLGLFGAAGVGALLVGRRRAFVSRGRVW
jgi:hypothetical protein